MSGVKRKKLFTSIFFNDLRRFWVIGVMYTMILFALVPFKIMLYLSNGYTAKDINVRYLLGYHHTYGSIVIIFACILIGLAIFNEIQKSRANHHIHSLPLSKKQIFLDKVLVGVCLILFACFINLVLTLILVLVNKQLGISLFYVCRHYLVTFLVSLIFFMQSVFFGIATSNILLQGFASLAINVVPYFIIGVGNNILNKTLVGRFNIYGYSDSNIPILPLWQISTDSTIIIGLNDIFKYLISLMVLFIISYILYIKRKNEKCNETIVFNFLNFVFKYLTTFMSMLLFADLFSSGNVNKEMGIFIGGFLGAFIGYYIAQMIISKEINVFKKLKGFYVYTAVMVIFSLLLFKTNIIYLNTPPKLDDVESAYMTLDIYQNYGELKDSNFNLPIKNKDTIAKIIELQEYMIQQAEEGSYVRDITIMYRLKNGKVIKRKYYKAFPYNDKLKEYVTEIAKDIDYKKFEYKVLRLDYTNINKVELYLGAENIKTIKDREKIKYICEMLRQDIINNNYLFYDYGKDEIYVEVSKNGKIYGQRYQISPDKNKWIYDFFKSERR